MKDLCEQNKYPHNLDVTEIFDIWEGHKHADILTYRLKIINNVNSYCI